MLIALIFVFQVSYADTTWPMYGGTLENTHFQILRGAMTTQPVVKWSYETRSCIESHGAAVRDIDQNDTMEVVIGSCDQKVYCLNGPNGTVKWSYITGGEVWGCPALIDVDGDGAIEVLIGSDDTKVYCLNGANGTVKWSYATGAEVWTSPAIADLDCDDTLEVVIGSWDFSLYCLNAITGVLKWSYATGHGITNSFPAVADVDGNDTLEVVIGSDDNKVYCFNGATGEVKWSHVAGDWISASPVVTDVDNDDSLEVVIGSCDHKVYCLNAATGRVEWSYVTGDEVRSSAAVTDVDGDGTVDVVVGSCDCYAYCLNGATGEMKWRYFADASIYRGISIADLDMDDKLEVLLPSFDRSMTHTDVVTCLNAEDGTLLWVMELGLDVHDITIADIDLDGCAELIVGTEYPYALWAFDDVVGCRDCGRFAVEERSSSGERHLKECLLRVAGRQIYLSLPEAMAVRMELYDLSGRLVDMIHEGRLSEGEHTFTSNPRNQGIYFVVLRTQKDIYSTKLLEI